MVLTTIHTSIALLVQLRVLGWVLSAFAEDDACQLVICYVLWLEASAGTWWVIIGVPEMIVIDDLAIAVVCGRRHYG